MYISDSQKEYIIEHYDSMLSAEISMNTGVARGDILRFAHDIGKSVEAQRTPIASKFDGEFIISNYRNISYTEIGKVVGLSAKQIEGWLRNHATDKLSKRRLFDVNYFENIDTPTKAYYLGFIYADGWITKNYLRDANGNIVKQSGAEFGMELQEQDSYILERLSDDIGGVHPITKHHKSVLILNNKQQSECDMAKIRVYSIPFVNHLHNNGIDYNKTISGVHPIVSSDMFIPFLKGYIDGDGCICANRGQIVVHITSCTKGVLDYINSSVEKLLGISGKIYSENDKKYRIMWFRRKDVRVLLDAIYSCNTPELHRKRIVYENSYGLSTQQ